MKNNTRKKAALAVSIAAGYAFALLMAPSASAEMPPPPKSVPEMINTQNAKTVVTGKCTSTEGDSAALTVTTDGTVQKRKGQKYILSIYTVAEYQASMVTKKDEKKGDTVIGKNTKAGQLVFFLPPKRAQATYEFKVVFLSSVLLPEWCTFSAQM